ncbi:MAG: hypothetical protein JO102_03960 [Elusimicrobia bacterium]|nr:hypothetical protein [Elusimicrobiota bacterium]
MTPARLLLDFDGIRLVRRGGVLFEPWSAARLTVRLEHAAFRQTLARLVERHRLVGMRVSLVLPRSEIFLIKSADGTPPMEIEAALRRQLPPELAEVVWTPGGENAVAVLPAIWLSEYRRDLEGCGLRLAGVGVAGSDGWLVRPARRRAIGERTIEGGSALAAAFLLLVASALKNSSDSLRGRLQRLERPLGTVLPPRARVNGAVAAIADLLGRVPPGSQLSELTFDADSRTIEMKGRLADYVAISTFEAAVSSAPAVSSARVDRATLVTGGGRDGVDAAVQAVLR